MLHNLWWKQKNGIKPPWTIPLLSIQNHSRGGYNLVQAQKILTDYQESESIKMVEDSETQQVIPWFFYFKTSPPPPPGGYSY